MGVCDEDVSADGGGSASSDFLFAFPVTCAVEGLGSVTWLLFPAEFISLLSYVCWGGARRN